MSNFSRREEYTSPDGTRHVTTSSSYSSSSSTGGMNAPTSYSRTERTGPDGITHVTTTGGMNGGMNGGMTGGMTGMTGGMIGMTGGMTGGMSSGLDRFGNRPSMGEPTRTTSGYTYTERTGPDGVTHFERSFGSPTGGSALMSPSGFSNTEGFTSHSTSSIPGGQRTEHREEYRSPDGTTTRTFTSTSSSSSSRSGGW
eukprot:TRINITY_DN67466_c10_g3_i1.p1 TRINITY_DN67466_c10_g3~~TRINITY_DN67466_c10_g3_i1.p1  ORF type:complete len:198 (-),score=11.90 TRINITY_DN67466_c10_g3_i1:830-1423(-)